jgi:hypothetical protein
MVAGMLEWPPTKSGANHQEYMSAPIALFVYRRPVHTRRTLESLMSCAGFSDHPFYVFSDGPKNSDELSCVRAVRKIVRELVEPRANIIESEENCGLAVSILAGVGRLCEQYGEVIVVEDDLLLEHDFLNFLQMALNRYRYNTEVMQVSGFAFSSAHAEGKGAAYFLPFVSSWGWATWGRAWNCLKPNAEGWEILITDRAMRRRFDVEGAYNFYGMLLRQMAGRLDSWAIRWYWSVFSVNGMVLYPPRTLVHNQGFDGSGTHGRRCSRNILNTSVILGPSPRIKFPKELEVDQEVYRDVRGSLRRLSHRPLAWLKWLLDQF